MSISDLHLFSEDGSRDELVRAGLEEFQLLKIVHAISPPPEPSSPPKATTSSPASRHPQCDWAVLEVDGFSAIELKLPGCGLSSEVMCVRFCRRSTPSVLQSVS
jgi:hypothetical protein